MAKKIKLTQGKYALVDEEDFDELNKYKWHAQKDCHTYYAKRRENGTKVYMHRQILGLKQGDGKITDHINSNGLDNRRENLRVVSKAVNCRNHREYSDNTSGHTGVSWCKLNKKWITTISVDNKMLNLGYHSDILDAVESRKQGEIKYWGGVQHG